MNKIIIIAMRIRSGLKKENEKEIYGIAKGRELKKKKNDSNARGVGGFLVFLSTESLRHVDSQEKKRNCEALA